MTTPAALVSKLRNYCRILRDDGLFYSGYVEQLTFLLILKMADQQSRLRSTTIISAPSMPILNVINITGQCQIQS